MNAGVTDGPYIYNVKHNEPLGHGITYKVKVRVCGDYIRVYCHNKLNVTVTNIADLPETMRWHLACLLAKEDEVDRGPDEMAWGDHLASEGWKDIGWRMYDSTFVVITPEQELIDLKRRYISGDTGSESKSQGEESFR